MNKNTQATSDLNVLANIYQPGTLNIIGGLSCMVRTALALNLARQTNAETAYFCTVNEYFQLTHGARLGLKENATEPLWVHLNAILPTTVDEIRDKVLQMQTIHPIRWVIVDYLQLLEPCPMSDGTSIAILEGLKAMAEDFQIAVIAMSQLARYVDSDYRTPDLQQLKNMLHVVHMPYVVDDVRLISTRDFDRHDILLCPDGYNPCNWKDAHGIVDVLSTEINRSGLDDCSFHFDTWSKI